MELESGPKDSAYDDRNASVYEFDQGNLFMEGCTDERQLNKTDSYPALPTFCDYLSDGNALSAPYGRPSDEVGYVMKF